MKLRHGKKMRIHRLMLRCIWIGCALILSYGGGEGLGAEEKDPGDALSKLTSKMRDSLQKLRNRPPSPSAQADSLYQLAIENHDGGNIDTALVLYSRVIELDPERTSAFINRGIIYGHYKQAYDQAIADLRQANRLSPDAYSNAYAKIGIYLILQGNLEEARLPLQKAFILEPENSEYAQWLGHFFSLSGDANSARDYYKISLALAEKEEDYTRLLRVNLQNFIEKGRQTEICQKELDWLEQSFEKLRRTGYFRQDGDPASILREAEKIFGPDHVALSTVLFRQGIASSLRGEYEDAALYYGRAVKIYEPMLEPSHPLVRRTVANQVLLCYLTGRYEEGERLLGKSRPRDGKQSAARELELVVQTGHADGISSVAFSPDGRFLLSGSHDHTAKLWEVNSGREIRTFSGHTDQVRAVAFSPDGKLVASAGDDIAVRIWDAGTGAELRTIFRYCTSIAFSPDGKLLAGSSYQDNILIWDIATGTLIRTLTGHTGDITSLAFSPEGLLASGSDDCTVRIWDVKAGREVRAFGDHAGRVGAVAFSPDGLLASGSRDGMVAVRDIATGETVTRFKNEKGNESLAFSLDGKKLASGATFQIKIWEVATGSEIHSLVNHSFFPSVAFGPQNQLAVGNTSSNHIEILNIDPGEVSHTFASLLYPVEFDRGGARAVLVRYDTVMVLDVASGEITPVPLASADISAMALSPDGKQVACARNGDIEIRSSGTGRLLHMLAGEDIIDSLVFIDGSQLISFSERYIHIRDWESGQEVRTFENTAGHAEGCAFHPETLSLACRSDGEIAIWDLETGKERLRINPPASPDVLAFSSDGTRLAGAGVECNIHVWDTSTGALEKTYYPLAPWVISIAFTPDDRILVVGITENEPGNYSTQMWEVHPDQEMRVLEGRVPSLTSVAFSPDSRLLSSGHRNGAISTWDLPAGRVARSMIHRGGVESLLFGRDGTQLASRGFGSVWLWNMETGKWVANFRIDTPLSSMAFDREDKLLALISGGHDSIAVKAIMDLEAYSGKLPAGGGEYLDDSTQVVSATSELDVEDVVAGADGFLCVIEDRGTVLGREILGPQAEQLASIVPGGDVKIWSIPSGEEVCRLEGPVARLDAFSPDGRLLVGHTPKHRVFIWDISTGDLFRILQAYDAQKAFVQINAVVFSPDGRRIAIGGRDGTVAIWDISTGARRRTIEAHDSTVSGLAFDAAGTLLASGSESGTIKLWEVETGRELATLIALGNEDWAVIAPRGHFDASPNGMKLMHWVVGLESIDLEQLKERYYEPGLLQKVLGYNPEPLRDVDAFTHVDLYPGIELDAPDRDDPHLGISLTNRGGGIGRVTVQINGKEIRADARGPSADPDASQLTLDVDLTDHPYLKPGEENTVTVKAYNAEGYLVSRGATLVYTPPGKQITEKPHLWAIVAGVSDYQGERLDLRYAAKDACDLASALQVGAYRLFGAEKVHLHLLTTDDSLAANAPTRANILRAFEDVRQARPTDLLVVYLAGHGVTHGGQDGDFYYLTQDARSAELTDPAMRAQVAFSSGELTELVKQVPALKQVLILDTCASGRLVERLTAQRSVPTSQLRALDRMKDRTGLYVLAGCAADAVSYEASRYGQGLLTYSLLLGMRGGALRADRFVDVSRLFEYAADQVPQLARDIGGIQRPMVASPLGGSSFDIGEVTGEDQARIPLARVRPLVLRASIQDADRWSDPLGLTKRMNEALREVSSRGREASLVYVDAVEFPDAYRLAGRYRLDGASVQARIKVFRGEEEAGELAVAGSTADIARLVADILEETEQLIAGEE